MKNKSIIVTFKAGQGKGHHGHVGRVGAVGGSLPKGATARVMTPEEAAKRAALNEKRRQRYAERWSAAARAGEQQAQDPPAPTYRDGLFYSGTVDENTYAETLYAGSHPDIQALADRTGLIATDQATYDYIKELDAKGVTREQSDAEKVFDDEGYRLTNYGEYGSYWIQKNYWNDDYESVLEKYGYASDNVYVDLLKTAIKPIEEGEGTGNPIMDANITKLKTDLETIATNAGASASDIYGRFNEPEMTLTAVVAEYKKMHESKQMPLYTRNGILIRNQRMPKEVKDAVAKIATDDTLTAGQVLDLHQQITQGRANINVNKSEQIFPPWVGTSRDYTASTYGRGNDSYTMIGMLTKSPGTTVAEARAIAEKMRAALPPDIYSLMYGARGDSSPSVAGITLERMYKDSKNTATSSFSSDPAMFDAMIKLAHVEHKKEAIEYVLQKTGLKDVKVSRQEVAALDAAKKSNMDYAKETHARLSTLPTKYFTTHVGLSSLSATKDAEVRTTLDSTWDRVNHTFTGKYNGIYAAHPSQKVVDAYNAAGVKYGNKMTRHSYHGTHYSAAQKIASAGFIVPKEAKAGRMMGDGVYLAVNSSKSMQYIGSNFGRSGARGVLFVTDAYLGRIGKYQEYTSSSYSLSGKRYNDGSYDTIFAAKQFTHLINDEYAVVDPTAVIVKYWIDAERG